MVIVTIVSIKLTTPTCFNKANIDKATLPSKQEFFSLMTQKK